MTQSNLQSASQSGAASPSAQGDDQGTQPYDILIKIAADGSISVGVQPGDDSDDDSSGGNGGSDDSSDDSSAGNDQPARNIKQALTIALEIYRNAGAQDSSDADFDSGYAAQGAGSGADGNGGGNQGAGQ